MGLFPPSYVKIPESIELPQLSGRRATNKPKASPWLHQKSKSWRHTILNGAIISLLVLILNIVATVAAFKNSKEDQDRSARNLHVSDCQTIQKLNRNVHFVINVLSTLLLSASNFAMQCLSAPTRKEVDRAHARKYWLDIGVLSLRNLRAISKTRVTLLLLLSISSLPLHMFYNSAVYWSVAAHDYKIFTTTDADLLITSSSTSEYFGVTSHANDSCRDSFDAAKTLRQEYESHQLKNLSLADCISAYESNFQTAYVNLILVTNETSPSLCYDYNNINPTVAVWNATLSSGSTGPSAVSDPYSWICGQSNGVMNVTTPLCLSFVAGMRENIAVTGWRPFNASVAYCLAELQKDPGCQLQVSIQLLSVVIAFNVIKLLVLGSLFFFVKDNPLLTMGDAIGSFLKDPDGTTTSLCLMGRQNIDWWYEEGDTREQPRPYESIRQTWGVAASGSRWLFCVLTYSLAFVLCSILFFVGTAGTSSSMAELLRIGFGATDPRTLLNAVFNLPNSGASGLVLNAVVANMPQIALSFIYYSYNSLFTCFMLGREWDQLARRRKGLRVSRSPSGAQRSTYCLQLPYRFAFPLMAFSSVLHYLCANSLFLVSVQDDDNALITCGYSPVALLALSVMLLVMLVAAFLVGNRKVVGVIPFAGTCSASMSAMCHLSSEDFGEDAASLPVQWGATAVERPSSDDDEFVGHCTVSHRHVEPPEIGKLYAGLRF